MKHWNISPHRSLLPLCLSVCLSVYSILSVPPNNHNVLAIAVGFAATMENTLSHEETVRVKSVLEFHTNLSQSYVGAGSGSDADPQNRLEVRNPLYSLSSVQLTSMIGRLLPRSQPSPQILPRRF